MSFYEILPSHYHADGRRQLFRFLNQEGLQIYISKIAPGTVTAWHCHKLQTDTWVVLEGHLLVGLARSLEPPGDTAKVWLYDPHQIVRIPPNTWHGYYNPGPGFTTLLNITDSEYNPSDELRTDADILPNFWSVERK